MLHQVLHDYLTEQCQSIANAIPVLTTDANEKALHILRVSVKKAKSLFTLAKHFPGYSLHIKRPLKTLKLLQSAAGSLRDIQLQMRLLKSYEKQLHTTYPLLRLLLRNNQALDEQILKRAIVMVPVKLVEQLPKKLQVSKKYCHHKKATPAMVAYLKKQYDAFAIPPENATHQAWHQLRKQAKQLHFQLHMLDTHISGKVNSAALQTLTKEMGDVLGSWHDYNELLLFVKQSTQLAKKEKVAIPQNTTRLIKQLTTDCRQYQVSCITLLEAAPAFYIAAP
jgi:CHAD domain-containing protein